VVKEIAGHYTKFVNDFEGARSHRVEE
jgi:hypothetical protein